MMKGRTKYNLPDKNQIKKNYNMIMQDEQVKFLDGLAQGKE